MSHLDDVLPALGGVVGAVERVEAAGEDVRPVAGADDRVHLLHPPPLVEVVEVRAVEVDLPSLRHLDRGAQHVPATKPTTHIALAQFLSETICQSLEPTGNDRDHVPGAGHLCSDSEGTIAVLLSAKFACCFGSSSVQR